MTVTAVELGGDVLTIELDVTDAEACEEAVARTVERHGGLDLVWANAGIASFGPLGRTGPRAWARTVEVNLMGAYNTVHAALPRVIERRGYVAVTASLASFAHPPGMSAYSASKAGVEAMCNSLRTEVAHLGVGVGTIHPTWLTTAMVDEAANESAAYARLRAAMRPPLDRTYPVERAAREIARGFERRSRRICTPSWVWALQALRSALTTSPLERDLRRAAPEIERAFVQEIQERGVEGASVSRRVGEQV
jgi:NAD(P)-dependent dehydrogenase (short-subunit alcohol dehydrogenase family)